MSSINFEKHILEGWTVGDFIDNLRPTIESIMQGESCYPIPKNKVELSNIIRDNQPYYKKTIPEVVEYFARRYNL